MTYRDILNETLKLMNVDYDADITLADIEVLKREPNIQDYIFSFYGALNRAFSEIENRGVLPNKVYAISTDKLVKSGNTLRFDTSLIEDLLEVTRVTESGEQYSVEVDYNYEGKDMILPLLRANKDIYTIVYKPKIERVSINTAEDYEVKVPDYIANYIPYFIKGDIYRGDEPSEANQAMNFFDMAMRELTPKQNDRQTSVDLVFNMEI